MKNTILKILKFILLAVVALIVILLAYMLVLYLGWPRWVTIFLLLGIVGLLIGWLFLKKLLLRRKEQQFVQQVLDQDEALMKNLAEKERTEHRDLQEQWKNAVETLRRSHLKKAGNPLYVLPWYLVMGESGSGKTTSLNSAHLSSPFAEVNRVSGISGTRNCDWWFFEKAILLDTAGRYSIPVHEERDKDEWQKFLSLLVKYRKREPIHGLIVTVAADKLLSAAPETLEEDARKIRHRADELMRVLGIKFPIYLLVTKCDLIQGMASFCDQLPEKGLDQPMGLVNQDLSRDVAAFLENVITSTGERLRTLRLLQLHEPSGAGATGSLLFPEEFENLKKGLHTFVMAAFKENPYQETPLLRGLFFSSGRQEGTPYSHFLSALGLIGDKDVLPGTSKGLFLHDFFSEVLPKDRGLFAPTRRALEWQILTRNLGLVSWVLLGLAAIGLLTYACVKNASTIEEAFEARPPEIRGELKTDLSTMERYRRMIVNVETRNKNWWIPRFGLHQSIEVERELKKKFCRQFRERFLAPFDATMNNTITTFNSASPEPTTSPYIEHVTRRINLLTAARDGAKWDELRKKPFPIFIMPGLDQGMDDETRKQFGFLFINYLLWRTDREEMNNDVNTLQQRLVYLLGIRQDNLDWLVSWGNRQDVPSLTMQSFWGGSPPVAGEKMITPAFTRKGKELINSFLGEITEAHPNPPALNTPKASFETSYRTACYTNWQEFAAFFPRGPERLRGEKEWQQMAEKMPTDQGPYFAFLNTVTTELGTLSEPEGMPAWLKQVFRFQILKSAGGAGTIVTKTTEEGKRLIDKFEKAFGRKPEGTAAIETQSAASKAIQDYRNALSAMTPAAKSRTQAYQLALPVFTEESAEAAKSPFLGGNDALARIKTSIGGGVVDDTFFRLVSGPFTFMWAFTRTETACYLQTQWEEKVLQEAQGAMDQQMAKYLLEQDGPVWKFMKGPAAPFVGWRPGAGYYSKTALGGTLPMDTVFFNFLSKGAKVKVAVAPAPKQNYTVNISGLPTGANPEARYKPSLTRIEMQCSNGAQTMENLNYPVRKTFNWSPEGCGDVVFQIEVGDIVLTRRYSGPQAFASFIQQFRGGRRTFYPRDFPGERKALENMGIRYIQVTYQFSGDTNLSAAPAQVKSVLGMVPRKITRCWE